MFWKKKEVGVESKKVKQEKLSGPKGIPDVLGRHLVVALGQNPDWVWNLKCVMRERNGSEIFDTRIFDEGAISGKRFSIRNYLALDEHPELILYEGWYNKKTKAFDINGK